MSELEPYLEDTRPTLDEVCKEQKECTEDCPAWKFCKAESEEQGMTEIWKSIQGYEGLYEISNLGNVRSIDRVIKSKHNGKTLRKGQVLTPFYEEKKGYYQVRLSKDGKNKKFRIHRLVALAFLENPFNYTDINHKDEIKTNNNVDNLEWCTRKYNNNYGTKPQRTSETMKERYRKIREEGRGEDKE